MTRRRLLELEAHLERLAGEHEGPAFVEAVRRFAAQLDGEERDVVARLLLARAPAVESAVGERSRAKGWIRRMLDRADRALVNASRSKTC